MTKWSKKRKLCTDLQHFGPLLLLGNEEGEWAELVIRDDGAPARGVGHCTRLKIQCVL